MIPLTDLTLPDNHAALAGHFPGAPIFPGVVLLQEILHCLSQKSGLKLWRVAAAKFHRPVTGGCVLTLWTDAPAATVPVGTPIRFELRRLDAVVVSGQVEAGAAAP